MCVHSQVHALHIAMATYSGLDLSPIATPNPDWNTQTSIYDTRVNQFMDCLFHYGMNFSFFYRYAGNNYIAAYRNEFIESTLDRLRTFLDGDLLREYERVIKFGATTVLNLDAETSRNEGNHPSIAKHLHRQWT